MRSHTSQPLAKRFGRRHLLKGAGAGVAGLAVAASTGTTTGSLVAAAERQLANIHFDFATGNAPIEVIVPTVIPPIFGTVSPVANDATLVLRITAMITNAWFDAIAPYHPTAVGVYSQLGRQPAQADNTNKNIAIFYASYRVLNSLLPQHTQDWRGMLQSVGLDPDDNQQNADNAIGIGNSAGTAVVAARLHDGMNQLGDEGGQNFHRQPYADYTGYRPVNTAYMLSNPSRWQPRVLTAGNGIFRVQQFVTPQMGQTTPYSIKNLNPLKALPPVHSNHNHPGYKQQVDQVLAASAALTDHQKMMAELFDNKLFGLGFSALFVSLARGLTLDEFVQYDFLTNAAAFDVAIVVWKEKVRFDAVRPFSAVRHVYGNSHVTAWGGPGQGTVSNIPASQWRSYLGDADHPEYPSGSSAFCAAHAEASRRYFNSDDLGWSVDAPAGSSRIEPGVTPSQNITLGPWATWTEFEQQCGLSRLWGGVHFMPAIESGWDLGRKVGALAHTFVQSHIDGNPV